MDSYVEIHLREDPDFPAYQLMSAFYGRFHRALVTLRSEEVGISFPGHDNRQPSLGTHIRLHGPAQVLDSLMRSAWLDGVRDHLKIGPVMPVPASAAYRQVLRVQAKSSPARLRRRAMRRQGIDAATASGQIPDSAAEVLRLPFAMLGSRSTAQPSFPLFVRHGPVRSEASEGRFNSYGLSKGGTVPWF